MNSSSHLDRILERQEGHEFAQVVFVDIVRYSMRRSKIQKEVVDKFTDVCKRAISEISRKYEKFSRENGKNFSTDAILIPTGDGLAVVFSFINLHEIHIDFASRLIAEINSHNSASNCEIFFRRGWCNCHDSFYIRVGIHEGNAIYFKDINGAYNVAGATINLAARLMGLVDDMQIATSKEVYDSCVNYSSDPRFEENFMRYERIPLKHSVVVDVYQFVPAGRYGVNCNPAKKLAGARNADSHAVGMAGSSEAIEYAADWRPSVPARDSAEPAKAPAVLPLPTEDQQDRTTSCDSVADLAGMSGGLGV